MKKRLIIGLGIIVVLFVTAAFSIYPDWLWFENLGLSPVFMTMLLSRFGFGFLVWLLLLIVFSVNIVVARRLHPEEEGKSTGGDLQAYFAQLGLSGRALNTLLVAGILIFSLVVASRASAHWEVVLRFLYQEPFGSIDPVLGKDVGFYVFSLPFLLLIRNGLMYFVTFAVLLIAGWYLMRGALQISGDFAQAEGPPSLPSVHISPAAGKHLLFLGGLIVLLLAWGFQLKIYGLLYSTQGPAFGASFTDVHVKIIVYRLLALATLALAVVFFLNVSRFRKKQILLASASWVGAVLVLGTLLPVVVQKLIVKPNELAKESAYIGHNIRYTREAYGLSKIKEVDFTIGDSLTMEDIRKHDTTIQNIRIWDERPLLQTYRQIQAIRLYYNFNNVDVDRYRLDGRYRQLMLAARELIVDQLPAQANTWVNRHLIYTHGYGLAASPVNEVTSEGLPRLFIKDLPPSYEAGLKVERPEIYYGEKTDRYVIVETEAKEFDYPKGDKNVYSSYKGKGGVPVNSFVRRVLFAFEFLDPQIFFTTYLTPDSRLMYRRRIDMRVRNIAPFLEYDRDPYLVVSEGRLFWIQDAYTISDMYPYSKRIRGRFGNKPLNYIRNSVKVIVDAYDGAVSFYLMDTADPVVKTYSKIFPGLFKPFEEMPADLQQHLRYPRDLFEIQMNTYGTYHMEDIQVFYNQEDLWQIPDELYGDSRQEMKPYYIIIKLPEGEKEEFLLMTPFTPSKKDNMIGWLAARSDLPNYGGLLVYKLPKEKLVYGPMQIEARVDQQTEISRELSLWGQRGSRVIRGNLLAIPIGDSFIYVEPIYLEAIQEESEPPAPAAGQRGGPFKKGQGGGAPSRAAKARTASLPELKRVIVAHGDRLVMSENLEKALNLVVGGEVFAKETGLARVPGSDTIQALGVLALERYHRAKEHLRQGNWAGYGEELAKLEKLLTELSGRLGAAGESGGSN